MKQSMMQTFWSDEIVLDATGMGMKEDDENLASKPEQLIKYWSRMDFSYLIWHTTYMNIWKL